MRTAPLAGWIRRPQGLTADHEAVANALNQCLLGIFQEQDHKAVVTRVTVTPRN
jgi:hypothetical protein